MFYEFLNNLKRTGDLLRHKFVRKEINKFVNPNLANYILLELLLDLLWQVPLDENEHTPVTQDHIDFTLFVSALVLKAPHKFEEGDFPTAVRDWMKFIINFYATIDHPYITPIPQVVSDLYSWLDEHTIPAQLLTKYKLINELETSHQRAPCGEEGTTADNLIEQISRLQRFDQEDGSRLFLLALKDIFEENSSSDTSYFDIDYLQNVWEQAGGEVVVWSPCDTPAKNDEIRFCFKKIECKIVDWTQYLFEHS